MAGVTRGVVTGHETEGGRQFARAGTWLLLGYGEVFRVSGSTAAARTDQSCAHPTAAASLASRTRL